MSAAPRAQTPSFLLQDCSRTAVLVVTYAWGRVPCYPNFGSNFLWTTYLLTLLRCARDVARSAYAPAFAPDTGKYPLIDLLLHPQSTTTTTAYYTGNSVPNKPLNLRLPAKPGTALQAKY
jgi:hypothetical protein